MKILRSAFLIIIISSISLAVVYFFYQDTLEKANRTIKVIKPDNYTETIKNQLSKDDIVQITGTPDLLHQVSQEALIEGSSTEREIEYYYVGLQEYGYDFVVRIVPGKLFAEEQTFTGVVTGINDTDYETRIRNSLNKPINFEDSVNAEEAQEIDEESQEQLSNKSIGEFKNSSLLILDNEIIDRNQVLLKISFWTVLISALVITLFRKSIFGLKK